MKMHVAAYWLGGAGLHEPKNNGAFEDIKKLMIMSAIYMAIAVSS